MYPGAPGSPSNHKKGYCSDGVKQVIKTDTVPDWPQPPGIFKLGTKFHPLKFLATIHEVYENVVIKKSSFGEDLPIEYTAFGTLLHSCTITTLAGQCLFKLFDLEMLVPPPPELIVKYEGLHYLQMDCLQDGN
jgi:hypothetical protein